MQEVNIGQRHTVQTRRAAADDIILGNRSREICYKQGIPHTCATGTCLQVSRWGDDEEQDVQRLACVACILGLSHRRQPAGRESVDEHRRGERRLLKITFNPMVHVYRIKPYSEVYGAHPKTFNFDKYGNHQSTGIVPSEDCQHLGRDTVSGGVRNHAMQIDLADRRIAGMGRAGIDADGRVTERATRAGTRHEDCIDRVSTRIACSVPRRAAQAVSARPLCR